MSDANDKPKKKLVRYTLSKKQETMLKHWHYHGDVEDTDRFEAINNVLKVAAETIMELTPPSRQQSLALTDLESARMWANAAIAVHECMIKSGDAR